jgi:hypothetical protein
LRWAENGPGATSALLANQVTFFCGDIFATLSIKEFKFYLRTSAFIILLCHGKLCRRTTWDDAAQSNTLGLMKSIRQMDRPWVERARAGHSQHGPNVQILISGAANHFTSSHFGVSADSEADELFWNGMLILDSKEKKRQDRAIEDYPHYWTLLLEASKWNALPVADWIILVGDA